MEAVKSKRTSRCFGLFTRRERWGLSFKGVLAIGAVTLLAGVIMFFYVQPFLCVTERVDSRILVVEGWIHDFAFDAAVKEFRKGRYEHIYSTGGPIEGQGGYINDAHTYASLGAAGMIRNGMPEGSVQMVSSRVMDRDRTYGSAVALRDWFKEHSIPVTNMNVLTEAAHARRTRLLFQETFGKSVKVGIISIPNPDYAPKDWWRKSAGVREVIGEGLAYIYAKFFFWPSRSEQTN